MEILFPLIELDPFQSPQQGVVGEGSLGFSLEGVEFCFFQVAPWLKSILLDPLFLEAAIQERV